MKKARLCYVFFYFFVPLEPCTGQTCPSYGIEKFPQNPISYSLSNPLLTPSQDTRAGAVSRSERHHKTGLNRETEQSEKLRKKHLKDFFKNRRERERESSFFFFFIVSVDGEEISLYICLASSSAASFLNCRSGSVLSLCFWLRFFLGFFFANGAFGS